MPPRLHLAYCTNIHPAESWADTFRALATHALRVRDLLPATPALAPFPLAPRLSARAARELLADDNLPRFHDWLAENHCYVFTVNGFPYGDFHNTRVKENVYLPDWTDPARLSYTIDLFRILCQLLPPGEQGSVSTLPGSFKAFRADETKIFQQLSSLSDILDSLSERSGHDLHLGLEPEPLGHFENTVETISFFERLAARAADPAQLLRRIGVNYDTCHFALEYDDCHDSLDALAAAGIRISKVHLSSAIALDPRDPDAIRTIASFAEPTYLHQTLARHPDGTITRFTDLPDALAALNPADPNAATEWRVHYHIPLDSDPAPPLRSTRDHARALLAYRRAHPDFCHHYEIETYTWSVLPPALQRPVEEQLAAEYMWVLGEWGGEG